MNLSETASALDLHQGEDFWQPYVDAFNSTNMSKIKYCRQNEVEYHKFLYWHQKLSQASVGNLLPVKLKSAGVTGALCTVESPKGYRVLIHSESALCKVLSWL